MVASRQERKRDICIFSPLQAQIQSRLGNELNENFPETAIAYARLVLGQIHLQGYLQFRNAKLPKDAGYVQPTA